MKICLLSFVVGLLFSVITSRSFAEELLPVVHPRFVVDLKYGTDQNFLKRNVYKDFGLRTCWVLPKLQSKLQQLGSELQKRKLKLVLWDCYRPLEIQKLMWKLVPDPKFVADPKLGSNHNRGAAADVALANDRGELLVFPTPFDDFSPRASHDYHCSPQEAVACRNRDLLRKLMTEVGLEVFPTEWWHYQLPQAAKLPVIGAVTTGSAKAK